MRKSVAIVAFTAVLELSNAFAPVPCTAPRARTGAAMSNLQMNLRNGETQQPSIHKALAAASLSLALLLGGGTMPANAVSGGVADFVDIHDQDLSGVTGKKYVQKDFSSCDARGVKMVGTNLRGSRFFKADLTKADLTGADLTGGSLENAKLEGTILTDVILVNGYTGQGFEKVKSIENVDFTDAQIRPDVIKQLCKRPDAIGKNPVTEVDTRESLGCP